MIERGLLCQAERHSKYCDGLADDEDHFTPRCISKLWSWKVRDMDSIMNTQPLNRRCHELKDRDTVKRKEVLKYQLHGGNINFAEHRQIFLGGLTLQEVIKARVVIKRQEPRSPVWIRRGAVA